jgi:hypothetical protein
MNVHGWTSFMDENWIFMDEFHPLMMLMAIKMPTNYYRMSFLHLLNIA